MAFRHLTASAKNNRTSEFTRILHFFKRDLTTVFELLFGMNVPLLYVCGTIVPEKILNNFYLRFYQKRKIKNKMKKVFKVLLAIIILLILAYGALYLFGTTDLQTDAVKKDPQVAKAKMLLQEMAKSHMVENWDNISTYTVRFQEEMFGVLGKSSNPFPEAKSQFD